MPPIDNILHRTMTPVIGDEEGLIISPAPSANELQQKRPLTSHEFRTYSSTAGHRHQKKAGFRPTSTADMHMVSWLASIL